ncbi:MAG: carboxypeptidase regulatory-like domain-containing protein [Planctomycetes bacterium]|nr:carboxypeptidase regulatory-like domain-containing protein [Planctomycetota bacterium]
MTNTRLVVLTLAGLAALAAVGFVLFKTEPAPLPTVEAPQQPVARAPTAPTAEPTRAAAAPLPRDESLDRMQRQLDNYKKINSVGTGTATLHGKVIDSISKQPVSQYTMALARTNEGDVRRLIDDPRRTRVWHNKLGTFTYRDIAEGLYNIHVRVLGYEELVVTNVEVPTKGDVTLELSRGAYVEGVVHDDEDGGIGGIDVRLRPLALDDPGSEIVTGLAHTDDDGHFLFSMVPPGTYEVALGNKNLSPQGPQQIYVAAGRGYTVKFFVPEQNDITIHVRDAAGNYLVGATVSLWSGAGEGVIRGETDETGEVNLHPVPPGSYTVKVWRNEYIRVVEQRTLNGVSDEVEWTFTLEPDPRDYEKLTPEELERLKNGERPEEVFGPKPTSGGK